jgi:hypothetical protein
MVDLVDPNSRARIANMLGHGGQARQRAVGEIMRGNTGVPAFEALAAGMRAEDQLKGDLKATLAKPVSVTYRGPAGKAR